MFLILIYNNLLSTHSVRHIWQVRIATLPCICLNISLLSPETLQHYHNHMISYCFCKWRKPLFVVGILPLAVFFPWLSKSDTSQFWTDDTKQGPIYIWLFTNALAYRSPSTTLEQKSKKCLELFRIHPLLRFNNNHESTEK